MKIGESDFKVIADLGDLSAETRQFAIDIDDIAGSQVKLIVIVRQRSVAGGKTDLNHRFFWSGLCRNTVYRRFGFVFGMCCRKTDFQCYRSSLPEKFFFVRIPSYHNNRPQKRYLSGISGVNR